jgi:hypothetical protein
MLLPAIAAMATIVVASNILVQFVIAGGLLTWGPHLSLRAFLVIDLTNRAHGPRAARSVVLWGFATGALCSLVGSQVILETGPAVPLRVAVASARPSWPPSSSTSRSSALPQARVVAGAPRLDRRVLLARHGDLLLAGLLGRCGGVFRWRRTRPRPGPKARVAPELGPEAPLWASLALADLA